MPIFGSSASLLPSPSNSAAFVHQKRHLGIRARNSNSNINSNSNRISNRSRQSSSQLKAAPSDIFVLSYDGIIADTKTWRSNLAISAALRTWPQLQHHHLLPTASASAAEDTTTAETTTEESNSGNNSNNSIQEGREWLINKSVTLSGDDGMMGCDLVLLARLMLEEQVLDEGRSNGCRGKYGSKFHPSQDANGSDDDDDDDASDEDERDDFTEDRGSVQGSRPLTVGEIAANWNDGACLKDTVRIKYNVDRKDPIPVIRREIKSLLEEQEHDTEEENGQGQGPGQGKGPLPEIYPAIAEALLDCNCPVYILVGDESHVPIALSSLSFLSIPMEAMQWDKDNMKSQEQEETNDSEQQKHHITIVPPGEGGRGHMGILQHIAMSSSPHSSIHVIHSDITTLQNGKSLFGDNRPVRSGMFARCAIGDDQSLKLSLGSHSAGPKEQNDAEMDPWLNLIDEFDIVESLSAQIVTEEHRR